MIATKGMGPTTVLLDEEKSDEEKNGNIFQMLLYYLNFDNVIRINLTFLLHFVNHWLIRLC